MKKCIVTVAVRDWDERVCPEKRGGRCPDGGFSHDVPGFVWKGADGREAGFTGGLLYRQRAVDAGVSKDIIGSRVATYYHEAFLKRWDIRQYDRVLLEVMDLGKRVLEFGTFEETIRLKTSGAVTQLKGKYADVWERTADGKLRLMTEAWNYNHPVSTRDQLVFDELPAVTTAYRMHVPANDPVSFELAAMNAFQERIITEHNARMWEQFYTDDFMMFYSNHPIYRGRREVEGFLEDHVRHLPVFEKLDIRTDRIDDLGEYVLEYASHIAIVRDGDWSGVVTGKDIRLWRRDGNGFLRICRGVAMYD